MAVAITAVEQGSMLPRVLISVTGLTVGDSIELYRVVDGERTAVRGGSSPSVTDTAFLARDAEMPFGVSVQYLAVVNGSGNYTTSPDTYSLPNGGSFILSDAISGQAVEVVMKAWNDKSYQRRASVFKVGGRTVVVSGDLGMFEATIELATETPEQRQALLDLLAGTTEGVIQIRQNGEYDDIDSYVAVLGVTTSRLNNAPAKRTERNVILTVAQVEGWAPGLKARGTTLQDIADAYAGLTLADIAADFSTLLQLAQEDFG